MDRLNGQPQKQAAYPGRRGFAFGASPNRHVAYASVSAGHPVAALQTSEGRSMSYFGDLSQGSTYHEARLLSDGSLVITVSDISNDECLRAFQSVITEAENCSD
jgi:hypothetical protein